MVLWHCFFMRPRCVVIIWVDCDVYLNIDLLTPPCWCVNNFLPSLLLSFSLKLFPLKTEFWVRQEALLLNMTVIYLSTANSYPFFHLSFHFFLPIIPFIPPHPNLTLLLTGGGCSKQMLKCLVWSGFTRRRATRDSPMNSLCVSLSSSHTDTLGVRDSTGRGQNGRKQEIKIERDTHT